MDTELLKRCLRILHLEDNENDHLLVTEMLGADGLKCEFVLARSQLEFAAALRRAQYDLIISDYSLPSYDGMSALASAQESHAETPFIFFSGTIGEDVAVESLKHGAVDYVLKQRPSRLISAVRRALRNADERFRLKRVERALRQSEERLRIVAKATNDVVWEWNVRSNQIWFSENFLAAFGHTLEPGITAEAWFDFIHPDDKVRVITSLSSLLAGGGRVWWNEYRFRRRNGSYAHVFDRASALYDEAGKPVSLVGMKIDISERKQAEDKIREQAALLDKAQDAIIVCTLDLEITFWNRGAERVYGWEASEVVGENLQPLLFRDAQAPPFQAAIKNLMERGEWTGELKEVARDGRVVTARTSCTLVCDDQKQPQSLLIINTDITEHKLLEEQFLRAQRLESLGVLVSGIAHDLNNTLVPIMMGVEILQQEPLSEDAASMVQTMGASARRSAEMVKQMLVFARGGESAKMLLQPALLLKEMSKIISDTFPKAIDCRTRVGKNLHSILCIPTQMHQVLMNLCVNARDAMSDRGTLTLAAENVSLAAADAACIPGAKPGHYICISVQDTGHGIPPEQAEKIFQPFFTTKAPGKGTGLGLSTCQSIVKNHDGFIAVHSQVNAGTEFKVFLPDAGVRPAEAADSVKLPPPSGRGERILVVDDEESILAMTRAALENYGYSVSTAVSGLEAVARFRENPGAFHLVITDHAMPFMDGKTMIAILRRTRPDIPIIVSSGLEKEGAEMQQFSVADGFLPKPFTTDRLLTITHDVLAEKNAASSVVSGGGI
jgi:PAS domain S-box-containing protein